MENLLSIGEVAKIRNVNVQSLRYYEKLGILIPAYINPETGYRYYSLEQIMILDTIILCVDLGIPLKDLKQYVDDDDQLEFERLLRDGRKLATQKIKKIESNLNSIDRTLQHIHAQKSFLGREGYYSRFIFERYIITTPCDPQISAKDYENKLSQLFDTAKEKSLQASFPHGVIFTYRNGQLSDTRMFLEVLPCHSDMVQKLVEGNYLCIQEPREAHFDPLTIFPPKLFDTESSTVICSCMSPTTYKYDKVVLEFQIQG